MRLYEAVTGVAGMGNQGINPPGLLADLTLDSPRPRLGRYWIVSRIAVEWKVTLAPDATGVSASAVLSHDGFPLASLSAGPHDTVDINDGDIWSPTEFFSATLPSENFIRLTVSAGLAVGGGGMGSGALFATLRLYGQNLKESR